MKFEIGNLVECIQNDCAGNAITVGKQYKVLAVDDNGGEAVLLKDDNGDNKFFFVCRFKKVEEMFKAGDILKCVRSASTYLTEGKEYICNRMNGQHEVYVVDNTGVTQSWYADRFIKVENTKMVDPKSTFEVDTVNQDIYNAVIAKAEENGFKLGYGMKNRFYRFLKLNNGEINGNSSYQGYPLVSINDFCDMKIVKPIMVGQYEAIKTSTGIKVGCTDIPLELVEKLYKLAKS